MFMCRIQDALTERRLNAEYYNPEYLKDDECLASWKQRSLDSLRPKDAPIVYGVLQPDEIGDTYRVAKAEYFDGMFVNAEDCEPISSELFSKFVRSESQEGDILIAIGGYVGRPARAQKLPDQLFLNINRHLARFRPDDEAIDPYFTLAYLSSSLGERQLTREITGSVQAGINLEDLRLVSIPLPTRLAQTYIGNKVRQAEWLRERSRYLSKIITCLVHALIEGKINKKLEPNQGFFNLSNEELEQLLKNFTTEQESNNKRSKDKFKKKYQRVKPLEVETERLDAEFYKPEYLDNYRFLQNYLSSVSTLAEVAEKIGCGPFGSDLPSSLYRDTGVPLYRVQNIRDGEVSDVGLVFLDKKTSLSLPNCRFKSGDILIAKSGDLGRVADVPSFVSVCNTTQDVIGVSIDKSKADPQYISAFLSSQIGRVQIVRWGQGNVQKHLNMPSVKEFLWLKTDLRIQRYIGDRVRELERLRAFIPWLTTAAKFLVEALIEGSISELDLQEAQKAIHQGNYALDRQILSRLTRKGILHRGEKTNEPPLFPDLDALYRVLSYDNDTADNSDWDSAPSSRQRSRSRPIQLLPRAAEASTSYRADDSAVTLLDEEVY